MLVHYRPHAAARGFALVVGLCLTAGLRAQTAGPLIINSPWISNTATNCLASAAAGTGPAFSVPACHGDSPAIPMAWFTVPGGYAGVVTSSIGSSSQGNNPLNTYNNVVLDSKNLGLMSPGTFTATASGGLQPVNVGTVVGPLQVAAGFMVHQSFPGPTV